MSWAAKLTLVVPLALLLSACNPWKPQTPPNADPSELAVVTAILPLAEHVEWNHTGTVDLVDLRGDAVGDEQLRQIASLSNLRFLDLSGTRITDDGLANVKRLPRLVSISVASTEITDAGVRHIAAIGTLECVDLRHTKIDDASLDDLIHLNHLSELFITGTNISDSAIQKFNKARPNCRLQR